MICENLDLLSLRVPQIIRILLAFLDFSTYSEIVLLPKLAVKEEGWTGFSKCWQGSSEGNHEEQPCQPEENPVHPDSFTGFTFYLK